MPKEVCFDVHDQQGKEKLKKKWFLGFVWVLRYFRCFDVSVFRCFGVSVFRCFGVSVFRRFDVSMFRFGVSVFRFGVSWFSIMSLSLVYKL